MRSKTSCFNGALFRKNLVRFVPLWGFYTLCLILGTLMLYTNGGTAKQYHFAANLAEMAQVMAYINLIYAPVAAQLLFGDLYSSRMCYALHAMPIRRETVYFTNLFSGLLFSILPTAVMVLVSLPLLGSSCFTEAWKIPLYVFAAANLEFLCFFGIAVFSAMCAGNRLGMALVYCLANFLSNIIYWLINTVYTPMLYGVVTSSSLAQLLCPVSALGQEPYLQTTDYGTMLERYDRNWDIAVAEFTLTDRWMPLLGYAAAGLVFLLLGLALYRKRQLERAGDALAFRVLEPLFQVLTALVTAAAGQFFLYLFLAVEQQNYLFLGAGLFVGWFGCRMLIERSPRVFRLKNLLSFGALALVLTLSLVGTHYDVLDIENWRPEPEDIESIEFRNDYSTSVTLTREEDFARILDLHAEALEERLEFSGPYVIAKDGSWIYNIDSNSYLIAGEQSEITDCRYAFRIALVYKLRSGREVHRDYVLWSDGPGGDYARECFSAWEVCIRAGNYEEDQLQRTMKDLYAVEVDGTDRIYEPDPELVTGLLEAMRLDAQENTMAQNSMLHTGHFISKAPDELGHFFRRREITVYLSSESSGWYIDVFPDSEHTLRYLQDRGLLAYTLEEANLHYN